MNRLAFLKSLATKYDPSLKAFSENTTFEDLHMDSYAIVDFLMKVEEEYNINIEDEEMLAMHSMQDVLSKINSAS